MRYLVVVFAIAAVAVASGCGQAHSTSPPAPTASVATTPPTSTTKATANVAVTVSSSADVPPPAHDGKIVSQSGDGVPTPFKPSALLVTNFWFHLQGTTYVQIYAGAPSGNQRQGKLVVTRTDGLSEQMVTDQGPTGGFDAPRKTGPLWLTHVHPPVVTFRYAGGTGTFNLKTGKFTLG